MQRLLNLNFMQSLLSVKTLQKFVAYFVAGLSIMLLIPSQANSHISIKSSGYLDNPKVVLNESIAQANPGDAVIQETRDVLNDYGVSVDYSLKDRDFSSSLPNNITKVKGTRKVTHNNSACARELLQTLSRYMYVNNIYAEWSYGRDNYIYKAERKSNNKSLQNEEQSVKPEVFPSDNLLVQTNHQRIDEQMIGDVQNTFRSHGVRIDYMQVGGNYRSDGQPCTLSFPCRTGSYCVNSRG